MLIFEKFNKDDFSLYEELVYNENVMKMNYGRVFTKEEAAFLFDYFVEYNNLNVSSGYYKVISREHNCFIGLGALVVDNESKTAEVEYMILPEFWHHGFGSKILLELLELSRNANLIRVEAIIDPENVISRHILEKADFSFYKEFVNEDGELAALYCLDANTNKLNSDLSDKNNLYKHFLENKT